MSLEMKLFQQEKIFDLDDLCELFKYTKRVNIYDNSCLRRTNYISNKLINLSEDEWRWIYNNCNMSAKNWFLHSKMNYQLISRSNWLRIWMKI